MREGHASWMDDPGTISTSPAIGGAVTGANIEVYPLNVHVEVS